MREKLTQLIADSYPKVATDLLKPILELIRLARKCCDGNVDKFLIILAVGIRTVEHPEFSRCSPDKLINIDLPIFPGLGTNARSIAESLEIPKESVRRKVAELIDAGWLVRERSRLYLTAQAYRNLAPVREQIMQLTASNYETLSKLLRSGSQTG